MTSGKVDGVDDAVIAEALAEWPSPVRASGSWDAAAQRLLARISDPVSSKASVTAPAWLEAAAAIAEAEQEEPASTDGFDAEWDSEPVDSSAHGGGPASAQTGPMLGTPPLDDDALFAAPLPRDADEPEEHLLDLPERRSGSVSPPMAGRSDTDLATLAAEPDHATERELVAEAEHEPGPVSAEEPQHEGASPVSTQLMRKVASSIPPPPFVPPVPELPELPTIQTSGPSEASQASFSSPTVQAASFTPPPMAAIDAVPASKRSPRQRAAFLGGIGLAAAAACVFVLMRARGPEPTPSEPTPSVPSVVAEPAPAAPVEEKTAAPPSEPNEPSVAAAQAPTADEKLPLHSKKGARAATPKRAVGHGKTKEVANVASDPLMRVAAAPTDPGTAVPQKPSNGAVQAAMSQVLPRARACIRGAGDDAVSRVTLTFDPSGKVQSSTLAGAASGKPAETCIRSALAKMKLPPFAEPKFSAIVTVRPP